MQASVQLTVHLGSFRGNKHAVVFGFNRSRWTTKQFDMEYIWNIIVSICFQAIHFQLHDNLQLHCVQKRASLISLNGISEQLMESFENIFAWSVSSLK